MTDLAVHEGHDEDVPVDGDAEEAHQQDDPWQIRKENVTVGR